MCLRSIAGAPSSHALLGFLITAPPSVCVPALIGAHLCGFKYQKKKKLSKTKAQDTELALCMTLLELRHILQLCCVRQEDGGGVNRGSYRHSGARQEEGL